MWSLEDYETSPEVKSIVDELIKNPANFVVKPQKEGGGNNFYDDDAKQMLLKFIDEKTDTAERNSLKQFMIMKRIFPPMVKAWMLREQQLIEVDSLSELGLYSCLFMDSETGKVSTNENFGTLIRTKGSHSNEGGVNSGFSVIDSAILYDSDHIDAHIKPNVN